MFFSEKPFSNLKMEQVHTNPNIYVYPNFLTPSDLDHIASKVEMEPQTAITETTEGKVLHGNTDSLDQEGRIRGGGVESNDNQEIEGGGGDLGQDYKVEGDDDGMEGLGEDKEMEKTFGQMQR